MPLFALQLLIKARAIIAKNWKPLLLILVIASVFMYHNHLTSTIDRQKHEIVMLTNNNSVLKLNNLKFKTAINKNNKLLSKLNHESRVKQQEFNELSVELQHKTKQLNKKIQQIKKPGSCEETIKFLIDAVEDYE